MTQDPVRELVGSADIEYVRLINDRLAKAHYRSTLEIERIAIVARKWRRRWAWSFGGNLLCVAAVIWYAFTYWCLN